MAATPTTIYLTSRQRKELFQRARKRKTSFSDEVRSALDLYLQLPPDFNEEALGQLAREASASIDQTIAKLDKTIAELRKRRREL